MVSVLYCKSIFQLGRNDMITQRIEHYRNRIKDLEAELLLAKTCLIELESIVSGAEKMERELYQEDIRALVPTRYGVLRSTIAKTIIENMHLSMTETCNILKSNKWISKNTNTCDVRFLCDIYEFLNKKGLRNDFRIN